MRFPRIVPAVAILLVVGSCDSVDVQDTGARSETLGKRSDQVEICHASNGAYSKIRVPGSAVGGHRGHGDGRPGEPVKGKLGHLFAEDCVPEQTECAQQVVAECNRINLEIKRLEQAGGEVFYLDWHPQETAFGETIYCRWTGGGEAPHYFYVECAPQDYLACFTNTPNSRQVTSSLSYNLAWRVKQGPVYEDICRDDYEFQTP